MRYSSSTVCLSHADFPAFATKLSDVCGFVMQAIRCVTSFLCHHAYMLFRNVVDLWEHLAEEDELLVDLGSDQTSLHDAFGGGYYPVQLKFEEARQVGFSVALVISFDAIGNSLRPCQF